MNSRTLPSVSPWWAVPWLPSASCPPLSFLSSIDKKIMPHESDQIHYQMTMHMANKSIKISLERDLYDF